MRRENPTVTQDRDMRPGGDGSRRSVPVAWLVLIPMAASVWLLWWGRHHGQSVEGCVAAAITQMKGAMEGRPLLAVVALLAPEQRPSSRPVRAAVAALRQCGVAGLPVVQHQLQIGDRRRRMAMQALLLGVGRGAWREAVIASMWKLVEHRDWRVREVAFVVLWRLERRPKKRASLWSHAATDPHHFLRYAASAAVAPAATKGSWPLCSNAWAGQANRATPMPASPLLQSGATSAARETATPTGPRASQSCLAEAGWAATRASRRGCAIARHAASTATTTGPPVTCW